MNAAEILDHQNGDHDLLNEAAKARDLEGVRAAKERIALWEIACQLCEMNERNARMDAATFVGIAPRNGDRQREVEKLAGFLHNRTFDHSDVPGGSVECDTCLDRAEAIMAFQEQQPKG